MSNKLGVICNIEKSRYYVITDGGDFVMQKGSPPTGKGVGDRVDLFPCNRSGLKWLSIAAALVLMVISSMHFMPLQTGSEDYRLTIDINPSIELSYNDQFQLTGWKAFNQAGADLLESLAQPDSVYEALAAIFTHSIQLGLAGDDHDVFITSISGNPLDEDSVLGAFEGRGAAVKLHLVHLEKDDYLGDSISPLKTHLKRKAGIEFDDDSPVATLAATHLRPELVTSIQVAPWHNNPLVQLFVEQYSVRSNLVEQMLTDGMTADQVGQLLELARVDKLTPADIFKELKGSGLPPGQFLQQHKHADKVKDPEPIVMDWLPEFLAQEFSLSAGQISSYLQRGIKASDLQVLLVLETMTSDKLQHLVRKLETSDIHTIIAQYDMDTEHFNQIHDQLKQLVDAAGTWSESEALSQLILELKVSRGEALSILAREYILDEAREIIGMASKRLSIQEVLNALDAATWDEEIIDQLDEDNKAPRVREKIKNNSSKGTPPGWQNPPGNSNGKGNN